MFAARQALRTTARVAARPLAAPARRPMSYDAFFKSALKSNMSQVTFVVAARLSGIVAAPQKAHRKAIMA